MTLEQITTAHPEWPLRVAVAAWLKDMWREGGADDAARAMIADDCGAHLDENGEVELTEAEAERIKALA